MDRVPITASRYKNIPTDLLRALVTVVEFRGFTRAAERLGRSQPAISLQIKRLEELLGLALFDRETGGAQLTDRGQLVAHYARRILALNDELLTRLSSADTEIRFRIGMPDVYAAAVMPRLVVEDRERGLHSGYDLHCAISGPLLQRLAEEQLDVVLALSSENPAARAALVWPETLCWIGRRELVARPGPLQLLAPADPSALRRVMFASLAAAARPYDLVLSGQHLQTIIALVRNGLGITAVPRRLAVADDILDDVGLPDLPNLVGGIYLGNGPKRVAAGGLAVRIGELLGVEAAVPQ
jgi:DNA-binding transcriptional LysR family regulator